MKPSGNFSHLNKFSKAFLRQSKQQRLSIFPDNETELQCHVNKHRGSCACIDNLLLALNTVTHIDKMCWPISRGLFSRSDQG